MVYVYKTLCPFEQYTALLSQSADRLCDRQIQKLKRFHFEKDACRYLCGQLLILYGLRDLGWPAVKLSDLNFTPHQKPYFNIPFFFNIAHAAEYVVCACSNDHPIGIDLERITPVSLGDFKSCFTSREWQYIYAGEDPHRCFYELWTRKEAVIKADGRGLHIPLLSFEVLSREVPLGAGCWYWQSLPIAPGYQAHLAILQQASGSWSIQNVDLLEKGFMP